jgi:hypothetical protein
MLRTLSILSVSVLLSSAVFANDQGAVSWEVNAEFSGVGDATFRRSSDIGDVSAFDTGLDAIASIQAQGAFLLRLGVELQRFDFSLPDSAPLPNNLESFGLVIGGDFQLGDSWIARVDLHPGFYSANGHLDGDDFNIPLTAGGSYFVSSDLQIVIGLSLDVHRKYPVLPAAGLRWKFAREWVLNAILPTPRIEYLYSDDLTLYAGADFRGGTYRVDDSFGRSRDLRRLDNAYVDYMQIRVGGGASWKVSSNFTVEVEAGCAPVNDFDFHNADIAVRAQSVPFYGRAGVQIRF